MYDYPFHMLFLIYWFCMAVNRAYYTGYVDAAGEAVPKLEEGITLRRLRYTLGAPFLLGAFLYLLNPAWMAWSQMDGFPLFLRWIGMALLVCSFLLYRWTHVNLDKNFTDTVYVREESRLVTSGPYAWVRHPMYVSAILVALGTGFGLANWFLGVMGLAVMFVIMYWRTPIEEEKLQRKYGEDYRRYKEKTGKFFPKIGGIG